MDLWHQIKQTTAPSARLAEAWWNRGRVPTFFKDLGERRAVLLFCLEHKHMFMFLFIQKGSSPLAINLNNHLYLFLYRCIVFGPPVDDTLCWFVSDGPPPPLGGTTCGLCSAVLDLKYTHMHVICKNIYPYLFIYALMFTFFFLVPSCFGVGGAGGGASSSTVMRKSWFVSDTVALVSPECGDSPNGWETKKNVPSGQEQASASSGKWNKRINYPQRSVALVLALVQGCIPPWAVGVSVREQAGLEVECIWRPWGCWWCGFQPTCCDRRPANQQQWHWEEDGGVRSLVTPEGQQSTAFVLEEIVVIIQ